MDLAIAESSDSFTAILTCTLSEGLDEIIDLDKSEKSALLKQTTAAVEPLLNKDDLLAKTDELSFSILFKRNREEEVEEMGETIYSTVSSIISTIGHEKVGVGMTLIDSSAGRAYELLGHAESNAAYACREGIIGYHLHGEEITRPSEPGENPTDLQPRERFLDALSKGLVGFIELPYSALHEHSLETTELVPEYNGEPQDPFLMAAEANASLELDRFVCETAMQRLGERVMQGNRGRLIFPQSPEVIKLDKYVEILKAELRQRQIVGTGLMVEFDLPALASDLKRAKALMGEISALGISILLRNFACNETAYKVLAYLKAHAVRPHPSLLKSKSDKIQQIVDKIHSLDAEVILPRVVSHGQISLQWSQAADFIQAEFSN
jgi:EAL domain-containing protein (putative c-di-GMP-specific phosphodiesterase class I)